MPQSCEEPRQTNELTVLGIQMGASGEGGSGTRSGSGEYAEELFGALKADCWLGRGWALKGELVMTTTATAEIVRSG